VACGHWRGELFVFFLEVVFFLGRVRPGPSGFRKSGFDPTPAPVPETMLSKEIIDSKIEFKFTTHSQIPFTPIITTLLLLTPL
jgi:hypothetical protein